MTLQAYDQSGVDRTISALEIYGPDGVNRVLSEIRAYDTNGVDRIIWSLAPPMSVSVSPSSVFGQTPSPGAGTATTGDATATPSGGTPPYSYAWTLVSYDGPVAPGANSNTLATTDFTQTSIGIGENYSAVFRCTVTDSTPGSPLSASDTVNASWADTS